MVSWRILEGEKYSALSATQIAAHPKGQTRTGAIPDGADFKAKDLLGIPWMVAFALRADGWYLRSDIIWHKPNPMPESVTDRPTKAHEYLFLLSKSARYFYDADAIKETATEGNDLGLLGGRNAGGPDADKVAWRAKSIQDRQMAGVDSRTAGSGQRNKRSVWTVATQPYSGAHFATFPPKLIEPCILAGTPERSCGTCGAPWTRIVERIPMVVEPSVRRGTMQDAQGDLARTQTGGTMTQAPTSRTVGFEPSCEHDDGSGAAVVLDPFAGSGTTGMVALRHGRSFVGCELNPIYAQMARERIMDDAPLLNTYSEVA